MTLLKTVLWVYFKKQMFKGFDDLKSFIDGRRCAVCVRCKDEWMGSFTARQEDLAEEMLVKQVNKLLSDKEFQRKLRENGYRIECSFLDSSKDKVYEIKAR